MDETNKIDTAAVRRQYPKDTFVSGRGMCIDPTIEALCDALDEARVDLAIEQGEKSEWQESCHHWMETAQAEHARAERLATQAGHVLNDLSAANRRVEQAEAKLRPETS